MREVVSTVFGRSPAIGAGTVFYAMTTATITARFWQRLQASSVRR